MKSRVFIAFVVAFAAPAGAASPVRIGGGGRGVALTLQEAIDRALTADPEVRAAARNVEVQQALIEQARALPNPELRGEVENVGGSGSRQGFEDTESTVLVLQRIELGGERVARVRIAEGERERSAWDHEAVRRDTIAATTKAFVRVLAAQERLRLLTEMERLAMEVALAVDRSVAAGASAPSDASLAQVAAARAEVARVRAERALVGAQAALAATWGGTGPTRVPLVGDLAALPAVPPEPELLAALDRAPALARWTSERSMRDAAITLERARRIPDVNVGVGGRHFSDNGDNALVFEVSLPLPLFDRNHGAIRAAQERWVQAKDEADAARASARRRVTQAYLRLGDAQATAAALATHVLPMARRSAHAVLMAFKQGAVSAVDVLDARRVLADTELDHLDALERLHHAAADIERLAAAPRSFTPRGGGR